MRSAGYTAAVLLGASLFPRHTYAESPAFARSKRDFRKYLQDDEAGLDVPDEAILDLFDSARPPSAQLIAIGRFLDGLAAGPLAGSAEPRNLFVYYVGHGFFAGQRQEYHLALHGLATDYESQTALKVAELADVIKQRARQFRRYVILDCCFAAEALSTFQGTDAMSRKAAAAFDENLPRRTVEFPRRGTALYCAADKDSVARSPLELERTMFTDALLSALTAGDAQYGERMTLADVGELAWERLFHGYKDPVRPALHCPDQSDGNIAVKVALFPNPGHTRGDIRNAELSTTVLESGRERGDEDERSPRETNEPSPKLSPDAERSQLAAQREAGDRAYAKLEAERRAANAVDIEQALEHHQNAVAKQAAAKAVELREAMEAALHRFSQRPQASSASADNSTPKATDHPQRKWPAEGHRSTSQENRLTPLLAFVVIAVVVALFVWLLGLSKIGVTVGESL